MDDDSIDYASEDYAAGFRDGHDLHKSVRGTLIEQLTTAQSEAAELRKEVERLRSVLRQCAEAPHSGWTIAQALARAALKEPQHEG